MIESVGIYFSRNNSTVYTYVALQYIPSQYSTYSTDRVGTYNVKAFDVPVQYVQYVRTSARSIGAKLSQITGGQALEQSTCCTVPVYRIQ
jgi:hypothetical protein